MQSPGWWRGADPRDCQHPVRVVYWATLEGGVTVPDHHDQHPHHEHHHHHGLPSRTGSRRALGLALVVTFAFFIIEVIGGIVANSLALLSDAAHMLSDAAALGLGLFAIWFAGKPPTLKKSFGFYRVEILAALLNGATLIGISIFILYESYQRLLAPPEVKGGLMMVVAVAGLVANVASALILSRGGRGEHSLNLRGAFLHVLGDALGSVGAIGAALVIQLTGWYAADPIISAVVAVFILFSSWNLVRESCDVLLEGTPAHLDLGDIQRAILAVRGVADVHDLHLWTITSGLVSMSCHIVAEPYSDAEQVLEDVNNLMRERFGVEHTTVQMESKEYCCACLPV